jgi:acetolactate synthase-1/2/3 large subunit
MLFERLSRADIPSFVGWFDPDEPGHAALMAETDLLITVEDRNMYPRVIGELPPCRKLAVTSDAAKSRKNEYLDTGDALVEDDPVVTLQRIDQALTLLDHTPPAAAWADPAAYPTATATATAGAAEPIRSGIVAAIADAMAAAERPVLVDDSQMFGGVVAEYYDRLPPGLRIFGGHGGFVGSGVSYATGLALAEDTPQVFCFLGDQAFTNNVQGFVAAGERSANVVYLVCNNGDSVSLLKQATTHRRWFESGRTYLHNSKGLDYARIAEGFGIASAVIDFRGAQTGAEVSESLLAFERMLAEALSYAGPSLIEMRLPSLGEFWNGIWTVKGFE